MPLAIIVAQWHHIALEIFVNTGSGNGLMPDGMKPLPQVDLNTHDINPKFFLWNLQIWHYTDIIQEAMSSIKILWMPFGIFIVSCYIGLHLIQFCYIPQVMMNGIIYYTMMS